MTAQSAPNYTLRHCSHRPHRALPPAQYQRPDFCPTSEVPSFPGRSILRTHRPQPEARTRPLDPLIETLLIDLDDTLYPPDNGVWQIISERIDAYMTDRLGLPLEEARRLRSVYLDAQGTTLKGLMGDFELDPSDYLAYVHQLDYSAFIHPDPVLRSALESLPQAKVVFTNASADHARYVLAALKLTDLFSEIIDIVALGYANKPDEEAYLRALDLIGSPAPASCLLADDRLVNLVPAKDLGMTTVLVGPANGSGADVHIERLSDLPRAMPQLLGGLPFSRNSHG